MHCQDCGDSGPSCGNYHVYVIELRESVLADEPGFPYKGKIPLPKGKKAYYVGQTTHRVTCRYKQHTEWEKGRKFDCPCFGGRKGREYRSQNKPGKYVDYHKEDGLRPEIYSSENPAVRKESEKGRGASKRLFEKIEGKEEELALVLRGMGHAVHYGKK